MYQKYKVYIVKLNRTDEYVIVLPNNMKRYAHIIFYTCKISLLCFKDYSAINVYSFYDPFLIEFSIALVTGWVYEEDPETNVRKWIRTPDD